MGFPIPTLTKISRTSAVLYGTQCWLLNLDNARQLKEPTSIWTRIQTPFPIEDHASVLEPVSNKHWAIGSDVIEMTFNVVPLKTQAMDKIARNIDAYDERMSSYPKKLRREILAHRAKMED